jgi:hypothetical protein
MKKNTILFIGAMAIICLIIAVYSHNQINTEIDNGVIDRINKELAVLNQRAPIILDSMTVLKSVSLRRKHIHYNLKYENLNIDSEDIENFSILQETTNAVEICSNPVVLDFVENGYTIVLNYNDSQNGRLFSNEVDQGDCKVIRSNDKDNLIQYFVENNAPALPVKIDYLTHWQKIEDEGNQIIFTYKFSTMNKDEMDIKSFKERLDVVTFQKNCLMNDMQLLLKSDVVILDRYIDLNDVLIFEKKSEMSRCL